MRVLFFAAIIICYTSSIFAEECNRGFNYTSKEDSTLELCVKKKKKTRYPRFKDYEVADDKHIDPIFPKYIDTLDLDDQREWIEAIHDAYESNRANFAGHYLFVQRGCGGGCRRVLIANLNTGECYIPKQTALVLATVNPLPLKVLDKLGINENEESIFLFKSNSKMLIFIGTSGENEGRKSTRGVYHFVWDKDKLALISKVEKIATFK